MKSFFSFVFFIVAIFLIYSAYTGYQKNTGFTDVTIEQVKQSIRDEFGKKNVTVTEVNLLRKNPAELFGFAKLKVSGIDDPIQKNCTATMSDDSRNYIWSCN